MSNLQKVSVVSIERPGFRAGIAALFDGYRYLFRTPDIWLPALVPIVVSGILVAIFGVACVNGALWLVSKYLGHKDPNMLWTIVLVFFKFVAVLLGLTVALFLAFGLAKPLSGPILERIARRVSTDLGAAPDWPTPTLVQDVLRSLQSTVLALVFTLPLLVPLVAIGIIFPPAAVITTPLQFMVTALGAAWDFCDYPLSIRGTRVADRIEFVRRNKGAIAGFGLGLGLLLLLPCSLIIVLPAGVIGAAHLTVAIEKWEAMEKPRVV
jgi:CysZ protein